MEVLFAPHFIQGAIAFASPFTPFRINLRSAQVNPLRRVLSLAKERFHSLLLETVKA